MTTTPRRFALRDGTWPLHQKLDALIGPLTDLQAYRRYLVSVGQLRMGVEASLSPIQWPSFFENWRPTFLSAPLQADMHDLQVSCKNHATIKSPGSVSELLGMLYVLEGSALGARILVKQAASLDLTSSFGARHLAVQTDVSNASWQTFLALLEKAPAFDAQIAITSASNVFSFAVNEIMSIDHTAGVQ